MSIKRFVSIKDNTITNSFKEGLKIRAEESNMGASDILEAYSIYGQASKESSEKSRILLQFPINEIRKKRVEGEIPQSGSVTFRAKLFNAEHGQTVATSYRISAYPILEPWEEGLGLDMEGFTDSGSCNWKYSNDNLKWITEGGTYLNPDYYGDTYNIETEFGQDFDFGLENFDVDLTGLVEEWIKGDEGALVHATGTVGFTENPAVGSTITLHATNGDRRIFRITTTGSSNDVNYDKSISVARGADIPATVTNLISSIDGSSLFLATAHESDTSKYKVMQAGTGIFGNTKIFTNIESGISIEHFANGAGAINNGVLLKLTDSAESGAGSRSYYTKRFFARGSQFFLKRPVIEAQWDDSVQDDRNCSYRSSALAPASDNKNNIYLYNKVRGQLKDIPGVTDNNLIVRFVTSVGTTGPDVELQGTADVDYKTLFSKIYVTASRVSTGVYKAAFEYSGTAGIAEITFTGDPGLNKTITLISADGTSRVYSAKTSANAAAGTFNHNNGPEAAATTLKAAIENNAGHGNKFAVTRDGAKLFITQASLGAQGNTTITSNLENTTINGASSGPYAFHRGSKTGPITDIWLKDNGAGASASERFTHLVTGSTIKIFEDTWADADRKDEYIISCVNLKESYSVQEKARFRFHSRELNWNPNSYVKATETSPSTPLKESYYSVKRVVDNLVVIPYSTSSSPEFSRLSYDISGSYMDLDMSILEPNYLYEIGILKKNNSTFTKQKEKFRFRVD